MKSDKYMPVQDAFDEVVGYRPARSTWNHWRTREPSVGKPRLETWLIAKKRMTTTSEVRRFLQAAQVVSTTKGSSEEQLEKALAAL